MEASRSDKISPEYEGPDLQLRNRKRKKDRGNGKRNNFMANLSEKQKVRGEQTCGWIRKGYLKKRNWIRKNTDDQDLSEKCIECVGKEITSKNLENH